MYETLKTDLENDPFQVSGHKNICNDSCTPHETRRYNQQSWKLASVEEEVEDKEGEEKMAMIHGGARASKRRRQ
jgi:hypothetical protein